MSIGHFLWQPEYDRGPYQKQVTHFENGTELSLLYYDDFYDQKT